MDATLLNRAQRRSLARRYGIDPALLGRALNRAGAIPQHRASFNQPGNQGVQPDPNDQGTTEFGALPQNAVEWEHWLQGLDTPQRLGAAMQSGEFKAALNSYANSRTAEREDMLKQMRSEVEASMTDFLKEHQEKFGGGIAKIDLDELKARQGKQGARPSPVYNNPNAPGAGLDGVFPDFYTFLQDIWHTKPGRGAPSADARKRMDIYNSYSEKNPSEGGFLVPEEFRSELLQLSEGVSIVRPRATIIPMGAPRLHIPCIDETSRVSSIWGGVVVYRTEEGGEIPESNASFASIKLDVSKQTMLSHVPNELIRDWGGFAAFMQATMPRAMSYFEDIDYISGNGAGAPLGALSTANTALITVSAASGQATATIVWENIIAMYARMLPTSLGSAVWIASPDVFVQLATMALSVGTGGSAIWLTDGRSDPVLTLLGRPVIMSEKAPAALGSQGDLSFVDFNQYLIGDYQSMTVESSPHVKFTSDKTTFRAIARNDGRPWMLSPITPHNNSATLSPYLQLAARP